MFSFFYFWLIPLSYFPFVFLRVNHNWFKIAENRLKPVLTQPWVNDGSYFDGTGYAEITFSEEMPRVQRFEQEVKLISHNGILLLLQKEVNTLLIIRPIWLSLKGCSGLISKVKVREPIEVWVLQER